MPTGLVGREGEERGNSLLPGKLWDSRGSSAPWEGGGSQAGEGAAVCGRATGDLRGPRLRSLLPPPCSRAPRPVAAGPQPSPSQPFVASVYFPVNEMGRLSHRRCPWRHESYEGISSRPSLQPGPCPFPRPGLRLPLGDTCQASPPPARLSVTAKGPGLRPVSKWCGGKTLRLAGLILLQLFVSCAPSASHSTPLSSVRQAVESSGILLLALEPGKVIQAEQNQASGFAASC